MYIGLQLVVG